MQAKEKSAFAVNVKKGRERKGWSQREASTAADIKLSTWGSYEEARAEPEFGILLRICAVLDIPMTDVAHFISDRSYFSTRYKEKADTVLQRFRKLKPRQRKAVLVLLGMDEENK